MICKVFSANEWLYPDTDILTGKSYIQLDVARQSYACAQLLIKTTDKKINVGWKSSNAEFESPEIFKLHPIHVEFNTAERGFTMNPGTDAECFNTRQAPFWVYDALEPIDSKCQIDCEEETLALYLRWSTAVLKAGQNTAILQINEIDIPVTLTVYSAEIPSKETLRISNWFCLENMATYHGVEMWSEEHWQKVVEYAKLMRHARQTDFSLPPEIVDIKRNEDGVVEFDFSRAERLIKLFLSLGFRFIESLTPIHRVAWESETFVISIFGEEKPVRSDEAMEYLKKYFSALYDMLKRNKWLDITTQHVADEPHAGCADEYKFLSEMIRKWMPDIPIIEAVETHCLDGAVDIWVPKNNHLSNDWDIYNQKRLNGDELWFYTCCIPGGKHLNRLLDQELLRTRYLHWINYLYLLPGYLHWGFNFYHCSEDPFNKCAGKNAYSDGVGFPCGDTHIVYPGGDKPWGSVRLEMMRSGCEDYEMLKMLSSIDEEKANSIVSRCVKSFTDYTTDVSEFEKAYKDLLLNLEKYAV